MQAKVSGLSAAQSRSRLHIEQQEHLSKLKVTLTAEPKDFDVSSIDLVGLTGQLIFFQRQILMTMASCNYCHPGSCTSIQISSTTNRQREVSFISLQLAIAMFYNPKVSLVVLSYNLFQSYNLNQ